MRDEGGIDSVCNERCVRLSMTVETWRQVEDSMQESARPGWIFQALVWGPKRWSIDPSDDEMMNSTRRI